MKDVLRKLTAASKMLIVLDNADDQEVFGSFMKAFKISRHHMIITSRRDIQWASSHNSEAAGFGRVHQRPLHPETAYDTEYRRAVRCAA